MIKKFADVLEIRNGKNQKAVENPHGKYPIYGSGGLIGFADDYICEANTVIIGRKGSINNPIFVEVPFWNVDTAFGLVADERQILPQYLYYFCKHYNFEKHNKAVTIPSLTKTDLLEIQIDIPDLNRQLDVIEKLQKIEAIVGIREQQLNKLNELIKARFVELFGNPVTNPMEWELHRFDSLCKNLDFRRRPITATERETGIYPYYGASGIVDYVADYIFDENILLISEDGANLLMRSTPIAFSVSGKVWVNNHAHVVRFEKMSMQKYVEVFFSLIDISDHITGSAQPKLSQAKLNAMMFPVPSDERLETFLHFVSQVDKSKVAVQKSLDKTQQLFDSLMQKYFG